MNAKIYEFCNEGINKFTLLLRKSVYPYEYMDGWQRLCLGSLPEKEAFYSSLNMEDITDIDHRHAKKKFENPSNKNLDIVMICMFRVIHYCLHMFLKILETCVLKYMN